MVLLVLLLESRECIDDGQLPFILCTSDPNPAGKMKFLGDGYKLLINIIRGMYFSLEIKDLKSNFKSNFKSKIMCHRSSLN